MNILVADDSSTVRGLLIKSIQKIIPNALIIDVADGKQALKVLTQTKIDLIITDLDMIGGCGEGFIAHLEKSALLRNKHIIVFSSKECPQNSMPNLKYVSKGSPLIKLEEIIHEIVKTSV